MDMHEGSSNQPNIHLTFHERLVLEALVRCGWPGLGRLSLRTLAAVVWGGRPVAGVAMAPRGGHTSLSRTISGLRRRGLLYKTSKSCCRATPEGREAVIPCRIPPVYLFRGLSAEVARFLFGGSTNVSQTAIVAVDHDADPGAPIVSSQRPKARHSGNNPRSQAGKAERNAEIVLAREGKLHHLTGETWAQYCLRAFGITRQHANRIVARTKPGGWRMTESEGFN